MIERHRVFELICRNGWNATAFQTLEAGYSYFFDGDDACVAYVDTGSAWVAAGAPIAAHNRIGPAAVAFRSAARAAGRRCCFFATEDRFRIAGADAWHSVPIGEQPVWDPSEWRDTLARHRSLREQLRRARAKGVVVRRVSADELRGPFSAEVLRIVDHWLQTLRMAPMTFLVRVELLTFLAERGCFAAELDGRLIAVAGVIPVPARGGWFLEDLVRDPDAPNGTAELLVDAVMSWAAADGCTWVTLGLAPLAGELNPVLRFARNGTRFLYDFEGVRAFKAKLRPKAWLPIYLSYPREQSQVASHLDVLRAFAAGNLLAFGMRTALRMLQRRRSRASNHRELKHRVAPALRSDARGDPRTGS